MRQTAHHTLSNRPFLFKYKPSKLTKNEIEFTVASKTFTISCDDFLNGYLAYPKNIGDPLNPVNILERHVGALTAKFVEERLKDLFPEFSDEMIYKMVRANVLNAEARIRSGT